MKKWLIRISVFFGVMIALAAVGGLALWSMTGFAASSSDAPKQLAEWKKNGLPLSADEVVMGGAVSDEQNAAADFKLLRNDQSFKLPKAPGTIYEEDWASGAITQYLEKCQPQISRIALAAEKPHFQLSKDFDSVLMMDFPEYEEIKSWTKLLILDAERLARTGRNSEATSRIRSARNLARLTGQDPTMIGRLVAIACESMVMVGAGRVASEMADDPQSLESLRKALAETEWSLDSKQIYRTEAYLGIAAFRDVTMREIVSLNISVDLPGSPSPQKSKPHSELPKSAVAKAVVGETMRFWNEFHPRIQTETDMTKLSDDISKRSDEYATSGSWPKKVASIMLPVFKQANRAHEKTQSERKTLNAFIATLLYRNQHKKWPVTLEDAGIKGDLNRDHLAGGPLQYRASAKDMRIWHSGANGIDDGGLTMKEALAAGKDSQERDAVYIHPWPKNWRKSTP